MPSQIVMLGNVGAKKYLANEFLTCVCVASLITVPNKMCVSVCRATLHQHVAPTAQKWLARARQVEMKWARSFMSADTYYLYLAWLSLHARPHAARKEATMWLPMSACLPWSGWKRRTSAKLSICHEMWRCSTRPCQPAMMASTAGWITAGDWGVQS